MGSRTINFKVMDLRTTTWKSCNDTTILYTTLHFAPSKRATKLRLLRHDTASKAVLAILRRKFKPTPRSTTRSRLQPTARNNVVGTIPHTARSTLRDSSRSHCCKHLSLHCLRLSDLRHGPQRKEGASQEERHRQCSCRKGHRTIK